MYNKNTQNTILWINDASYIFFTSAFNDFHINNIQILIKPIGKPLF